jgi:hypothetical protein
MNDDSPMPFPPPQDDRLSQEEINTRLAIAELLSDAERRGQDVLDHAKGKALEEAEKIIAAAAEEASAAMIRHGESVERDGGIQRLIEFPPELRQAGIAILSYFSEVLKQKYPDQEMAVRIEQFGTMVRMTIDSPSGWRNVIERDLAAYGDVVVGRAGPESLLHNELDILRLQNKLDLARVELEFEKRVNTIALANSTERIASLEYQLNRLHGAIAMSLAPRDDSSKDMAALLAQYSSNEVVLQALQLLNNQLSKPVALANREAIEAAAKTIHDRDPSVLRRVYDIFSATATGAAGTLLASWIEGLLK